MVSADGEPANPEDLLIAYALGVPYVGQHGDDLARWQARFGDLVVAPPGQPGHGGGAAPPRHSRCCTGRGSSATGCSRRRRPAACGSAWWWSIPGATRCSRTGWTARAAAGVEVALGTASTAARFGCASEEVAVRYAGATAALGRLHPAPFLPVPGGLPLIVDGRVVGGLGVGGLSPLSLCRAGAYRGR